MVAVRAVQEGLASLAMVDRGLEGAAETRPGLSVQGALAAREPIFQVKAGGRNRKTTSGQDPSVCKSVASSLDLPPPTSTRLPRRNEPPHALDQSALPQTQSTAH